MGLVVVKKSSCMLLGKHSNQVGGGQIVDIEG